MIVAVSKASWLVCLAACGRIGFGDDGPSGLVVSYSMDDDPSTGTATASDAAYNGRCTACPTATSGRFGGGYHFDGTAYIALPDVSSGLVGVSPYTITVWTLPGPPVLAQDTITEKPYSATTIDNVAKLFVDGNGDPDYETTDGGIEQLEPVVVDLMTGGWHCLAASWDGVMKRLYADGVLLGGSASPGMLDSSLAMTIGCDVDVGNPAEFYVGALDELRFYGRALTDAEVAEVCL
jgi:hypothetical protein